MRSRPIAAFLRWFAGLGASWKVAVVAFLVAAPTIGSPFFNDDLMHRFYLRGNRFPGGPRGIWDLYRFTDGGEGTRQAVRDGIFPWWADPHLKLAFMRPLASLWRALDFSLWGDSTFGTHLETCLVYAALVYVVSRVYARSIGGTAAGLGAVLFAIDHTHSLPIVWTANRYAIPAAGFAFAALFFQLRAREKGQLPLLGALFFALALSCGETSLGILGYLAASAWYQTRSSKRAELLALWPYLVVLLVWAVLYKLLDYGTAGSAFYIDPRSPVLFARAVITRFPVLIVSALVGPPAEFRAFLSPGGQLVASLVCVPLAIALILFLFRATRSSPAARALLVGGLLSAVPVCAVVPDDRLLLMPGVGLFGALALVLVEWIDSKQGLLRRVWLSYLVGLHLVLAPFLLPMRGLSTARTFSLIGECGARSLVFEGEMAGKDMGIVSAPDALLSSLVVLRRTEIGGSVPARSFLLSVQLSGSATVSRPSENVLEISNPEGENGGALSIVYRQDPLKKGETFETSRFSAEVLELNAAGLPSSIRYTFADPPDQIPWFVWSGPRLQRFELPAVGATSRAASADLGKMILEPGCSE